MQTVFIVNPKAGKVDASIALLPRIRAAAERAGIEPIIEITRRPGHAREIAARYAALGEPVRLYACGGDGTLNEVLQSAVNCPTLSVGCIPCGTGNDYVRNFGRQEQFWDLDAQLTAQSYPVDLIATGQGYGVDICAAGLDAQVAYGIPKFRRIPFCGGTTAYNLSILQALFQTFHHKLHITTPEDDFTGDYMMLAICNGQQYGGGYCAAPYAYMDDGLLDVVLVKPIPRIKLPALLGGYKKGEHLLPDGSVAPAFAPYIRFFRTASITIQVLDGVPIITTLDGECSPQLTLRAEIARHAANILLPPPLAQNPTVLQTTYETAQGE